MKKVKQSFLAEAAKAYIQMRVAKAGSVPEVLESERMLSKRYNISRPNIHQAVEELLADGCITRKPGKKLIYSNPIYSRPNICNIGLLSQDMYTLSMRNFPFYGGLFDELSGEKFFLRYAQIHSDNFEEQIWELTNYQFDAYFFPDISPANAKLMKALIAKGIPCAGSIFYSPRTVDLPAANFEPFPYKEVLRNWADVLEKHKFRRVLMFSMLEIYFQTMCELAPGKFSRDGYISSNEEIAEKLPAMMRNYAPDAILFDAVEMSHMPFFSVLDRMNGPVPPLIMHPQEKHFVNSDIEQRYRVIYVDNAELVKHQGRRTARKLKELLMRRSK